MPQETEQNEIIRDRAPEMLLFVGSYTHSLSHVEATGAGISVIRLDPDTADFRVVFTCPDLRNPSYLALSADGRRLYAVEELMEADGAAIVALACDPDSGTLRRTWRRDALGDCPCHLSLDRNERRLFAANYGSGSIVSYPLDPSGRSTGPAQKIQRSGSGPNSDRQQGPHAHQVVLTPDGKAVLVCDAGTDEVARYPFEGEALGPDPDLVLPSPAGSLPRHLVQSADGALLFVVHELACTIRSYRRAGDRYQPADDVSTLPEGDGTVSACGAIRLHPNEQFLYVSNRGHDSIAAFAVGPDGLLAPVGFYPTRGRTPRDFGIDPSGQYLVVANQDSHSLSLYRINRASGALSELGTPFPLGSPTCVLVA